MTRSDAFVVVRWGVHALVLGLCAVVAFAALTATTGPEIGALVLDALFLILYGAGGFTVGPARAGMRWPLWAWLGALTTLWAVLLLLRPEAAYLVFPLFFCFLHLLRPLTGVLAVVATAALAVVVLGVQSGWSAGGIIGPLIGAAVAIMIGLGYRALAAEAAARESLLAELLATQERLAETEREAGVQGERARLAREIHDTVAQGLSSIQMLLHAAERSDPDSPGVAHIRLARETAAADLAETRRFIRELTPPRLEDEGLAGALRRMADGQWARGGLQVRVRVADDLDLSMDLQTALLRLAQGAVANVIQHAQARTATIDLTRSADAVHFVIADDGRGFDPRSGRAGRSDSFGLRAAAERVDQLGGVLDVDSAPGRGTRVTIDLPVHAPEGAS